MKNILNIILLFLLQPIFCLHAQSLDTIRVCENYSTSIKFTDGTDINFIIFGNNPQLSTTKEGQPVYKYYDIFQQENIVIIKLKSKEAPLTTLDIKLSDGSFYHGFICCSLTPIKTFYDYSNTNTTTGEKINKNEDTTKAGETEVEANLNKLKATKQAYNDIALIKKNVVFQVVNIVNDNNYTYIKLLINNKSSNQFEIDGVTFKVEEGAKKSIFKKELVNQNYLTPKKVIYPKDKQIKAYSSEYIYFAIPLFTTNSGTLNIKIVEKNGLRNSDILIKASDLNNTKIF